MVDGVDVGLGLAVDEMVAEGRFLVEYTGLVTVDICNVQTSDDFSYELPVCEPTGEYTNLFHLAPSQQ